MISWESFAYAFVCGAMLTMSGLGLESAMTTSSLNRWDKRFFTAFFVALTLGSMSFFLELAAYVNSDLVIVQAIAYLIQSTLCVIPFPMLSVYLLRCCGEDWRDSLLFRIMLVLTGLYFALLCVSLFTDLFFQILPGGQLILGPAYPLLIMPVIAMLVFIAVAVIRRKDKLSPRYYRAFLVCLVPLAVALAIHVFNSAFVLINVCVVISAFAMYRIIMSEAVERDRRQQREIASQRASIAVLQMRPHFIYNTMTSVYYLCDEDPQLAKQVTMDFTTYLRKNFTAIASEDAIPFSEELEHTRAYLAVEQAQFEDDLIVDYDTPHTQFRLPPLTLQPIVENAIKHGMDPDSTPLHIKICTKETEAGSEVVVEDDGSGFEPANDNEPHIALENIKQRLSMMPGGRLTIAPREGGGTVVTVMVGR